MSEDDKGMIYIICAYTFAVWLLIMSLFLPIVFFSGHANANFLRQKHGIEMPWYQAAFIDLDVANQKGEFDVNVKMQD